MKTARPVLLATALVAVGLSFVAAQDQLGPPPAAGGAELDLRQVPQWSSADLEFFLHGSMSTEVVPEPVLQAFIGTYPDLFPQRDLANFGLLADPAAGLPVGFSRRAVPHLGGLTAVGINCAACHVGDVAFGTRPVRVLGMTSQFDAEAFFGAVAVATFRTADPANMERFLKSYLTASDPQGQGGPAAQDRLAAEWHRHEAAITAAMKADPAGANGVAPGALQRLTATDLRVDAHVVEAGTDLVPHVQALLKLFHNMRAALHIPDQPPDQTPPASGPGRNDAFGLLSAVLFGAPQPYAPVKYGLVWNLDHRHWVHWDGNTQSPIGRNLLAALGLGAPLTGNHGAVDFALLRRHTALAEQIRPPRYPLAINADTAQAGARQFQARCAGCHAGPEDDHRLRTVAEVGTEPRRAQLFSPGQAALFNTFLAELKVDGYEPGKQPGIRSTQKYWAPSLGGVWARSPYLHNGSVRTLRELLAAPAARARSFHRGSRLYDPVPMGYQDGGAYLLDTTQPGNGNAGHAFGTDLSEPDKLDLLEYLKTL